MIELYCNFCGKLDRLVEHHWHEGPEYHHSMVCHSCNSILTERRMIARFGSFPPIGLQILFVKYYSQVRSAADHINGMRAKRQIDRNNTKEFIRIATAQGYESWLDRIKQEGVIRHVY